MCKKPWCVRAGHTGSLIMHIPCVIHTQEPDFTPTYLFCARGWPTENGQIPTKLLEFAFSTIIMLVFTCCGFFLFVCLFWGFFCLFGGFFWRGWEGGWGGKRTKRVEGVFACSFWFVLFSFFVFCFDPPPPHPQGRAACFGAKSLL